MTAAPLPTPNGTPNRPDPVWIARGTPAYRRTSVALFLAGFSTFSLLYCVQPLLPLFARDFVVSPAESALALSLSTGFLALAILCAAAVSESMGRRSLMFGSMALAAALNTAAAFSSDWTLLLIIRALEGIALGGVPAVAMAYLAEEIDPRGLGLSMGLYIGGSALGGMIGRVVTGFVVEMSSWHTAMIVIGVSGLASAFGFRALLPPSRNFRPRRGLGLQYHLQAWTGHLRAPALPLLFIIGFLVMGSFVAVYNFAGFRLIAPPYNLNQQELGAIFIVYLFGVTASSLAGALADRIGRRVVLPMGVVVAITGVALTLLPGLPAMIAGIIALTIGFFMAHSVASSWVGGLAQHAKGHAASLYLLAYYVGASVIGSAGGWFWAEDGWGAVVAFTGAALVLALLAALRLRHLTASVGP